MVSKVEELKPSENLSLLSLDLIHFVGKFVLNVVDIMDLTAQSYIGEILRLNVAKPNCAKKGKDIILEKVVCLDVKASFAIVPFGNLVMVNENDIVGNGKVKNNKRKGLRDKVIGNSSF